MNLPCIGDVHLRSHRLGREIQIKIHVRCELLDRGGLETSKAIKVIAIVQGCSPKLNVSPCCGRKHTYSSHDRKQFSFGSFLPVG